MAQNNVHISAKGTEPADHDIRAECPGPRSSLRAHGSSERLSSLQVGCTPAFLWDTVGACQVHTGWHP